MGCDIHSFAEVRRDGKWERVVNIFPADEWERKYYNLDFMDEPFRCRSYGLFGFLANVRNYSAIPPLSAPKGLPDDLSEGVMEHTAGDVWDGHSSSWFSLDELLAFDYSQPVEDRRCAVQTGPNSWDGGATAEPGAGAMTTYQEFLPEEYFESLAVLKREVADPKDARIVFWFDN